MSDTKIVREFVNLETNTALDVDTLVERELTTEEQDKFNKLTK